MSQEPDKRVVSADRQERTDEISVSATKPVGVRRSKERLVGVLLTQTVVSAVLLILLAFSVKSPGSDALKQRLNRVFTVSLTKQELSDAYSSFKSVMTAPAGQWIIIPDGDDEESSGETQTATPESTEAAAAEKTTAETQEDSSSEAKKAAQSEESGDADDEDGEKERETGEDEEKEDTAESTTAEKVAAGEKECMTSVNIKKLSLNSSNAEAAFSVFCEQAEGVRPVTGRISSPFGYRIHPVTGNYTFHCGLDIAASKGTRIKAAFYGTVTDTGYSDTAGNYVVMSHSNALETRYYHCSKVLVDKGTVIRRGEVIALVGSTGTSTGPHLHFEVRVNGVRVDPEILYGTQSV